MPSEGRAFEGWLEGRPTDAQRQAAIDRARQQRIAWMPDAQAWDQFIQVQRFVGRQVRIQFWDSGTMYLLNDDEWPHPVEALCEGVVTLMDDGKLQAFLLLKDPKEMKTGGCSGLSYLVERPEIRCGLAPIGDLYEVETAEEPA